MRPLNSPEQRTLELIVSYVGDVALIQPTATGLSKSIMDATLSVRTLLARSRIHNYTSQKQGPNHKVVDACTFLTDHAIHSLRVSFYRPITKKGDPRIWISGLPEFAKPDDIIALFVHDGRLNAFNLSRSRLLDLAAAPQATLTVSYFAAVQKTVNIVAEELLAKLKSIARRGPVPAVCMGDTAIGRTLETLLGIKQNPNRTPDYRGIELKSYRQKQKGSTETRATLFAQVPDWSLSPLKSSAEILDMFGYRRDGAFKLYCEVSTKKANSQGLRFRLDDAAARLIEFSTAGPHRGDVAVWMFEKLHSRLLEKHRETFWIHADCVRSGPREHFIYRGVQHTSQPSVSQFDQLLGGGTITMDHLIKRSQGRVSEKGPLFKFEKQALHLLFPHPRRYELA